MKTTTDYFSMSKRFLDNEANVSLDCIKELGDVLRFHERKYYIDNNPVISDTEYDLLFKKLQAAEQSHPEWILADSPTQRVGSDLTEKFESVTHLIPMLSLNNSYNEEDLIKFDEQIHKLTGIPADEDIEYTVEPKFDGGSVALIYENDIFLRAATRGNGFKGEDFTNNAKQLQTLPLRVPFEKLGIVKAELRGEAVINKNRFAEINIKREEDGKPLFANPRNAAAGGLRTKDPRETSERGTEVFIFQIGYAVDANGDSLLEKFGGHNKSILTLGNIGFKVDHDIRKTFTNIKGVVEHIEEWEVKRDSYPYEIDGMVIKVDNFILQKKCGSTSHHPRWAIAFKFKAKQATTTLERVEYQVGKIGSITPVAKVSPVALAGVTVSSISLHNEDFITSKDIRIGDKLLIERAGDVIPYIARSMTELRTGDEEKINFPTVCPSCQIPLQRMEGEAAWRCHNSAGCPEQILQRLFHHVSKDAMDIDGLGPAQVRSFFEKGWIRDMDDIYKLDYDKIAELEGFGEKSAINLRNAIDKAKNNPIHRVLYGLSIHHLGKKVSKIIASRIENVMDLQHWTEEQFITIHEIGPVVARNIVSYFNQEDRVDTLKRMETLGVNMQQTEEDRPKEVREGAVFNGKTILFTGALQKMTRKEAQEMAEENGAKNISAVSSNLDYLVVGEKAGSKLKKAQSLGTVNILTEAEFLNLIG